MRALCSLLCLCFPRMICGYFLCLFFSAQGGERITPLRLTLGACHFLNFFLALAQFVLFLCLFALLNGTHDVHRVDARLILRIGHRPERNHVLNRCDEKGIGAEILQPRCKRSYETTVHINWTAAHPLQDTADVLDEIAARPRHNHPLRALAPLHLTDDLHGECTHLARRVEHGIRRSLHPLRHLIVRENRRHRKGRRCVELYRQRKKRCRRKALPVISQNVTSKYSTVILSALL